jgi:hypothetical protein
MTPILLNTDQYESSDSYLANFVETQLASNEWYCQRYGLGRVGDERTGKEKKKTAERSGNDGYILIGSLNPIRYKMVARQQTCQLTTMMS